VHDARNGSSREQLNPYGREQLNPYGREQPNPYGRERPGIRPRNQPRNGAVADQDRYATPQCAESGPWSP